MDYDFSSLNAVLTEFSDKIKALPMPNLSPEFLAALDNFSRNPQISSIQETARKFQMYYSNLYNPDLTATAISQAASKALNINIPYDYDLIGKTVSAMASYAESLTSLTSATSGIDLIVSSVSSALGSLDKSATSSENISDDYIELSEPLADIIQQIDDSIELPEADENNVVRVPKIDRNTVLSVLGIIISVIMALYTIQTDKANKESATQDHAEIVQILEQIEENTSSDSDSQ